MFPHKQFSISARSYQPVWFDNKRHSITYPLFRRSFLCLAIGSCCALGRSSSTATQQQHVYVALCTRTQQQQQQPHICTFSLSCAQQYLSTPLPTHTHPSFIFCDPWPVTCHGYGIAYPYLPAQLRSISQHIMLVPVAPS